MKPLKPSKKPERVSLLSRLRKLTRTQAISLVTPILIFCLFAFWPHRAKHTQAVVLLSWQSHKVEYFRENGEVQMMDVDEEAWPMLTPGARVDIVYRDGRFGRPAHVIELLAAPSHK